MYGYGGLCRPVLACVWLCRLVYGYLGLCRPGVNVIKVLHLYFTRVAIVSLAENIAALLNYKCKTFIKLTPGLAVSG